MTNSLRFYLEYQAKRSEKVVKSLAITNKSKIGQFFCRHKESQWCQKSQLFFNLSGDRVYLICLDCGKQIDSKFVKHD